MAECAITVIKEGGLRMSDGWSDVWSKSEEEIIEEANLGIASKTTLRKRSSWSA